jgi:hypothetical protein
MEPERAGARRPCCRRRRRRGVLHPAASASPPPAGPSARSWPRPPAHAPVDPRPPEQLYSAAQAPTPRRRRGQPAHGGYWVAVPRGLHPLRSNNVCSGRHPKLHPLPRPPGGVDESASMHDMAHRRCLSCCLRSLCSRALPLGFSGSRDVLRSRLQREAERRMKTRQPRTR